MTTNLAASIRARLKNQVDASGGDYNLLLTRYGLERLLYRLSVSAHAQNFVLKGAMLLALWYDVPQRPTRDADLLGFGADDIESIARVFREICAIEVDDAIDFDAQSVQTSRIRHDAGYGGVRVELGAMLDRARIKLQVDIGFGDVVTPAADVVTYPVLLNDLPAPRLRAYPKYTVIAEKLQALCVLGLANSRMKDYFDLWLLTSGSDVEASVLAKAIAATFARRQTDLPADWPTGLTPEFATDKVKQTQWRAFIRKNSLTVPALSEIVDALRDRLAVSLQIARDEK
ncbi:MAG: nucleotidyl transferase AbiEii/AbiGii toxin family protein [Rudaea sp.]